MQNKTKTMDRRVTNSKVMKSRGVNDYLERQEKAKRNQEYIRSRQQHPYSHVWNVKQGHFSYVK